MSGNMFIILSPFLSKAGGEPVGAPPDGAGEQENPGQGQEGAQRGRQEPSRFRQVPVPTLFFSFQIYGDSAFPNLNNY
jgi:hypothetical protein